MAIPSESRARIAPAEGDSASAGARPKLGALTSLRFAAAALIVVHHTHAEFGFGGWLDQTAALDQAVGFFFILSGFILAYAHPSLEESRGGTLRFLRARFARIYPLHLATFLLVFLLLPDAWRTQGGPPTLATALANLTLVQSWIPDGRYYFSYNGPSWSISTEATFYLLFPLLIYAWRRTWPWKLALSIAPLIAIVAFVNHEDDFALAILPYIHPLARLFEFTLGMTAALVWRALARRPRMGRAVATCLELALVALAAWVMLRSNHWLSELHRNPLVGLGGKVWLVHGGMACLPFAALVVAMALRAGLVSRALETRALVLLGEVSFAVYLLHHILLRAYQAYRPALPVLPPLAAYLAFLATLLVTSYLAWRLIERPCRRLLRGEEARPELALARS